MRFEIPNHSVSVTVAAHTGGQPHDAIRLFQSRYRKPYMQTQYGASSLHLSVHPASHLVLCIPSSSRTPPFIPPLTPLLLRCHAQWTAVGRAALSVAHCGSVTASRMVVVTPPAFRAMPLPVCTRPRAPWQTSAHNRSDHGSLPPINRRTLNRTPPPPACCPRFSGNTSWGVCCLM